MTRRLRVLGGEGNRMTRGASERIRALLEALYSESPVSGLTHSFYRYPARFSPQFARTAIEAFTQPGDTVFDPFMGGGTTVVEALALGRRCIGSDLNPLAKFLARAKTTPISKADARNLSAWGYRLARSVNLHSNNTPHNEWAPYQRNLPWWLRKTLEVALDSIEDLATKRQRDFARSSLDRCPSWQILYYRIVSNRLQRA